MEHSETITTFAAAFVAAQAKIKGAAKDATNPHFKSKYADLSSVMDACKEALSDQGIAVLQTPVPTDSGNLALDTVLMHKSGEWVSGRVEMPLSKNDPQGYGSAMTYARRYSLAAMVGVCPEDDDGESAMNRNGNARQTAPPRTQVQRPDPPLNMNKSTGEIPNNVPQTAAEFAEYGDLMDDERFEEAILNEMKLRSFTDEGCRRAQAAACQSEKVTGLAKFANVRRGAFITAIRKGAFDRYKDAVPADKTTHPKQDPKRALAGAGK